MTLGTARLAARRYCRPQITQTAPAGADAEDAVQPDDHSLVSRLLVADGYIIEGNGHPGGWRRGRSQEDQTVSRSDVGRGAANASPLRAVPRRAPAGARSADAASQAGSSP